jgi:uncharacterized membrane protein
MKNKIYIVCFLTLMMTGFASYGQVYRTAADTVKLNKEFYRSKQRHRNP